MNALQQEALRSLVDHLLEENTRLNLTSVRDVEGAWNKHILDSLQGLETGFFEGKVSVIDVGSGAGFPALPLAMMRPLAHFTLLDATTKKCAYLRRTVAGSGITARVIDERAEVAAHDRRYRDSFDVATARAVGSLPEVAEYCLPFVRTGGHAVLWRGKDGPQEFESAKSALATLGGSAKGIVPYRLPGHDLLYHLILIEKVGATPNRYPRRTGLPRSAPLSGT